MLNKTPGMEARTVDELSKDLDTILLAKYAPEVNKRLGKNNRAKITGGEEIVWFARKAGLEEVPVFFSYQRQV